MRQDRHDTTARAIRAAYESARPVDEVYGRARRAFEAGEWAIAGALYVECLALDRSHAETYHDLGVLAARSSREDDAIRLLRRAVALKPGLAEAQDDLCGLLGRAGRTEEALAAARAAVAARPDRAASLVTLGVAEEAGGDLLGAAASLRSAIEAEPRSADATLKLANVLRRLGDLDAALVHAERGIMLAPDHHGGPIVSGLILDQLGRHEDAEDDFAAAARLCPRAAGDLNAFGVICIDQGRYEMAAQVLGSAVEIDPAGAEAHGNLGLALQRLGRRREAFDAYVKAVTLDPTKAIAQSNLGGLLIDLGHLDAAISACRLAIEFEPTRFEAFLYLGIALRRQGRTMEALEVFRQALARHPGCGEALIEICDIRQHCGDWAGIEAERQAAMEQTYRKGHRVPPFQILALTDSPSEQQQAARVWASGFRRKAPPLASYTPRTAARRGQRLRIGYLSADFRTHATAMLIAELLERQDRGRFELVGYSCGDDDGSPMRRRLVGALDRFADIRALSHLEAARRIHADGIDILIDLKGYTRDARPEILLHRPAPIQVNFLGYPGTMGTPFIDYMIADRIVVPPDNAAFFDEKLVYLPRCYQPNDSFRERAATPPGRSEHGLPAEAFVFCCLNGSYKITPQIFDIWMRLLHRQPGSVLWLYDADGSASANLRREAVARGIDPGRLVFAPKVLPEDHLSRLALADLFLDTLPVNAHTTASEALWVGLPVVTCLGQAFAGRVAGSLLHAVGLPELVTTSLVDYEALAASLARDPARLGAIRSRLAERQATAPLFNTRRYLRAFEAALTRMADLRDDGRAPESFAIEDT